MLDSILVVATDSGAIPELAGGAKALGAQMDAVVFGTEAAAKAVDFGAHKVTMLPDDGLPEGYAESIAKMAGKVVLVDASTRGKLLAGMLASRLGVAVQANASKVWFDGDTVVLTHMVFGGAGLKTVRVTAPHAVVTVGPGLFEKAASGAEDGSVESVEPTPETRGIVLKETRPKQGEIVNLSAAKIVIGVGRGFAAKEDLQLARDLADAIGAEIACSRPVTEGLDWMPRERYVGVSGVMLKPDVYIAIGISGQIQHMVGINQAKTLLAINKDKNAPVFKQVDAGIVADLYEVLPGLTAKMRAR